MARAAKGAPTKLNLWVLAKLFPVGTDSIEAYVMRVDAPHMRRCLEAGLVVSEAKRLTLTPAGRAALGRAPVEA